MDSISRRLKKYVDFKGLNASSFATALGYESSEKISRLFRFEKSTANPSAEILQDIANKFEDLNITWLLTGQGDMVDKTKTSSDSKEKEDVKKSGTHKKDSIPSDFSLRDLSKGQQLILQRLGRIEDFLLKVDLSGDTNKASTAAGRKGNSHDVGHDEHQKPRKSAKGK